MLTNYLCCEIKALTEGGRNTKKQTKSTKKYLTLIKFTFTIMAKKKENNQPQEVEIIVEYEWDVIISRLKHHRERLNITKQEMREYIWETYKRSFYDLSDRQIIELGVTLSKTKNKGEIIF